MWNSWMVRAVRSVISCKVLVLMRTLGYQLRLFIKDSLQSFSEGQNCSVMGFPCRHLPSWLYAMSYALSLSLSSQMYFENTVSCEWFWFLNLQNFPLAMERDSTHTGSTIEDCILSYKSYFILDNSTLHVPIYNIDLNPTKFYKTAAYINQWSPHPDA